MKHALRIFVTVIAAAAALPCISGCHYFGRPSLAPYAELGLDLERPPPSADPLLATYIGNANILLNDDKTAILFDGFFSRPSMLRVLAGRIAPDDARITYALKRAGIARLAFVLPAHSHYDHAMDSPEVARRTCAVLAGSLSTANIARGVKFPEDVPEHCPDDSPNERLLVIKNGDVLRAGEFKITVFESLHSPGNLAPGTIETPLVPPVHAQAYKDGGAYSFLVEHRGKRIIVHASTHSRFGMFRGVQADIVFLGIALLAKQDPEFIQGYWRDVVQTTGAKLVIPVHWDDFTLPLEEPLKPLPRYLDRFDCNMAEVLRLADQRVAVRLMPEFVRFDLSRLPISTVNPPIATSCPRRPT